MALLKKKGKIQPQQLSDSHFYWHRPLGAPDDTFRLTIAASTKGGAIWAVCYKNVDALLTEIQGSQSCRDLQVVIEACTSDFEWRRICEAISSHHGRTLSSLRMVVGEEQPNLHLLLQLSEGRNLKTGLEKFQIVFSSSLRNSQQLLRSSLLSLPYADFHYLSLLELHLADPCGSVLLSTHQLSNVMKAYTNLRVLMCQTRVAVFEDDAPAWIDILDMVEESTKVETFHMNVVLIPCSERSTKKLSFAEMVGGGKKKSSHVPNSNDSTQSSSSCSSCSSRLSGSNGLENANIPTIPLVPSLLERQNALDFVLGCNYFRRKFLEQRRERQREELVLRKQICRTVVEVETEHTLDAAMRVLQEWYHSTAG